MNDKVRVGSLGAANISRENECGSPAKQRSAAHLFIRSWKAQEAAWSCLEKQILVTEKAVIQRTHMVPLVAGALYCFELFGNRTRRHVPPQKTKAEAVKALHRELRNLTLNFLEWSFNDVAMRVINYSCK